MTPERRSGAGLTLLIALLVAAPPVLAAQADTTRPQPPRPPGDTTQAKSDSTKPDTTGRDTIPVFLPVMPADVPAGPLPPGTRWIFTADSLILSNIYTLSDLLGHIPGVYVARGGWYGAPEIVVYGGHGAMGLELYWDGVPWLPLGRDSVWLDPARVPLGPVERVEVVMLPTTLRVYLVSARQRSTEPLTEVRISTGVAAIAQYQGVFAKRFRSGMGLSLVADYRNLDGFGSSSTTNFNSVDIYLKGQYVRSPRWGAEYQIVSTVWDRGSGQLVDRQKSQRGGNMLRLFAAQRADGLGARVEATLARAKVSHDSLVPDRSLTQGILDVSETRAHASAGVTLRLQGTARPFQIEARSAWQPFPLLTVSADARRAYYGNRGHGNRAHASAALQLPLGLSLRGEVSRIEDFQAPFVQIDSFQRATDLAGYVQWDRRPITVQAGTVVTDSFRPRGFYGSIKPVASLGAVPHSRYVSLYVSLRPVPSLQISGWYYDPLVGGGDFQPPTHGRLSVTFASKFWRVYKSGVLTLRGEVAAESWSRSNLGGRDSTGGQLQLGPATFVDTNIELRIGSLTAYWMVRNYNIMRGSYVSGLGYPKALQFYGVQWFFHN